jgi:hypothetical protein
MSSSPSTGEIAQDATWLAQALDPAGGRVRLVAMDRESYRAASFLDDRLMHQTIDAQVVPWPDVERAVAEDLRVDARWIFHIGHVGSTLISRLLGEIDGVLAVREPRFLRDLALVPTEVGQQYIGSIAKLMSRTFGKDEVACIKATSFVSEIAPALVPAGERALFLYAKPRPYIASILAGENSVKELRAYEAPRRERLARRDIHFPSPTTDADRAAAGWAAEMTALEAAADAMADRKLIREDFDRMLADMRAALERLTDFFAIPVEADRLTEIAEGPLMGRYSKALEYEYSAQLRADVIADAERRYGAEIDAALAMLDSAAESSPLLSRALAPAREG